MRSRRNERRGGNVFALELTSGTDSPHLCSCTGWGRRPRASPGRRRGSTTWESDSCPRRRDPSRRRARSRTSGPVPPGKRAHCIFWGSRGRSDGTHLDDSGSVQEGLANRLELLHLIQDSGHPRVIHIDQSKGSYVHRVVFEVLKIERFDIL